MASQVSPQVLDVGRVIGRGFQAIRGNFLSFFFASAILSGLPAFAIQYFTLEAVEARDPTIFFSGGYWAAILGGICATFLASAVMQGMLIRSTTLFLGGRDPDLGGSVRLALSRLLSIIGIAFCVGFLVMCGFILLIIPGIIVYCAFSIAIPAMIQERIGVFAAMQRSRDLTRGSRGQVFIVVFFLWIVQAVIGGVLSAVTGATGFNLRTLPNPLLSAAVSGVDSTIASLIGCTCIAALYVCLREFKEGASTDELADVFS